MTDLTEVSASEFRDNFAEFLNRVHYGRERVAVMRRGKPVVVLISVRDHDELRLVEKLSRQISDDLECSDLTQPNPRG